MSFLKRQFPHLEALFDNAADRGKERATNVITGAMELIPWVMMLIGGFVCTSKSPLNKNASKNKTCIQDNAEATGNSFHYVLALIAASLPFIVILENLANLLQEDKGDPTKTSDAVYVITQLSNLGYGFATCFILSATDHGSAAARKRLLFFAIKVPAPVAQLGNDLPDSQTWLQRVVGSMQVAPWSVEKFLDPNYDMGCETLEPPAKHQKIGSSNEDDHMSIFKCFGHDWPPALSDVAAMIDLKGLVRREAELTILLNAAFPPGPTVLYEFIDVNNGLKRLLKYEAGKSSHRTCTAHGGRRCQQSHPRQRLS